MLIKFSNASTTLIKAQLPHIEQLDWSDENILDLSSVKQLKGCRTELVADCLQFIQKLDHLIEHNFFTSDKEKSYGESVIKLLVESLQHYSVSSERYPRLKDLLNIIPDNASGTAGFILLISTAIATLFPPLAVIPLLIIIWGLMDLFFNNRGEAKIFKEILFVAQDELSTIQKADNIFKTKVYPPQEKSSSLSIPGPSRTTYSAPLFSRAENQSLTNSTHSVSNLTSTC